MLSLFRTPRRIEDLALFTRYISGAMKSRTPLHIMLEAYQRDAESNHLSRAIGELARQTELGTDLSTAMAGFPSIFPSAYRRLIALGEQSRTLGGIMEHMAERLEEGLRTYEHFRRAALYPIVVLSILASVIGFITIKIMPQFQSIFEQLGVRLPGIFAVDSVGPTILYGIEALLLAGILLLIAAAFGLRIRGRSFSSGRLALTLPIVGPVLRLAETARFANFLSLLLDNNLPLDESLGLLADASENDYVRDAILDFQTRFRRGERLGELIASQPIFPASMSAMVVSAEDAGSLAETLRGLGRFYNDRAGHDLATLRQIYEPIMLLLIGVLVGLILVSMYLPLFDLPNTIR